MQQEQQDPQTEVHHLGKPSDCVLAMALAITFMGFQLPEIVQTLSGLEVNKFLTPVCSNRTG
ncbi:hypothetical protein KQ303_06420 [Synechococcus sp. CS-1333]|uniref:hypothetical protein n=1 Tax=Synechococcus sp. CS-1333 TaxID=2848638 RepID=UPI00223ABA99|nr:hypothetical protein [Synechococcus sp. CS-1333]MCT0210312.1 hypothetical protein [Synechococcus sp. CS-1333]